MTIDPDALDAAASVRGFSGIVTMDAGDEPRFERAFGFAHRAHRIPHSRTMRYGIASGGKTFTALAVLRLVERGDLRLDDRVRPILGDDLPLVDDAVTIEQLLAHTSGIGDYLDEDDWEPDTFVLPVPVHELDSAAAFLQVVDGFPQVFPPGARFAYCNGGYIVLAIVIERVTGRGYHDVVEAEVCAPAGLAGTAFLRSDALPADAALGYLDAEGDRSNLLHLPVRGNGDGGIFTTADDLHRFWRAFVAGDIVDPATVELMTMPRHESPDEELRAGLGLWLHPSEPILAMDGYDAGVSFRSLHDPRADATVSMLGNSSIGAGPVLPLVDAALVR